MSKPVPFDDGRRPARVTESVRVTICPLDAFAVALVWIAGFVLLEAILVGQLLAEGGTAAAWGRFLLPNALLPFALRAAWRSVGRMSFHVMVDESALNVRGPKGMHFRALYRELDELGVSSSGPVWLRARMIGGREVSVPANGLYLVPKPTFDIVRIAAPRLHPAAILRRDDPPPDAIGRLFWDHLYDPPAVDMKIGRRYRYLCNSRATLSPIRPGVAASMFAFLLFHMVKAVITSWGRDESFVWLGISVLVVLVSAPFILRSHRFLQGLNDRFEVADDGMWVIRGARRWKVTHPKPAHSPMSIHNLSSRPILRYGRGWNAYYFDPRLIEEDEV